MAVLWGVSHLHSPPTTTCRGAPTEAGPSSTIVGTTPSPSATLITSLEDTTTKEMELDYIMKSSSLTSISSETTNPVVPDLSDTTVAINIAATATAKAGTSGSSETTNVISKCWANIVSNKKASSSQMDKWAS
ncbi:hypothetical protein E4T56_gene11747 [Termitomyces sp. T112]|nr:hypothetical protein E4T56_gene11747 [Termitomyces sp. T112]